MGLFWDILQQSQISSHNARASSLESRVEALESELRQTRQVLQTLLERLETHFGEDLNRDGRVG